MPGDQPVQEVGGLGDLLRRARREGVAQLGRDGGGRAGERATVVHDGPDVGQRLPQHVLDGLRAFGVGEAVDQHVHPGFPDGERRFDAEAGLAGDLEQLAGRIPLADQDRVQHPVHGEVGAGQRADDGLDQERHVVVDDVDDGAGVAPPGGAVGCGRRVEHPDLDLTGCRGAARPASAGR